MKYKCFLRYTKSPRNLDNISYKYGSSKEKPYGVEYDMLIGIKINAFLRCFDVDGFLPCVSWLCLLSPPTQCCQFFSIFLCRLVQKLWPLKTNFSLHSQSIFWNIMCTNNWWQISPAASFTHWPAILSYRLKIQPVRIATPAPSPSPHTIQYVIVLPLIHICFRQADNCIIRSFTIMDLTKFCRKTFLYHCMLLYLSFPMHVQLGQQSDCKVFK